MADSILFPLNLVKKPQTRRSHKRKSPQEHDATIVELIAQGRFVVDADAGLVYSSASKKPGKPVGVLTPKGYLRAHISYRGKVAQFMVHRIVWVSRHGPLPEGVFIDHLNAVKNDNRIANLEAVTNEENMRRAVAAGAFTHVGRKNPERTPAGKFADKNAPTDMEKLRVALQELFCSHEQGSRVRLAARLVPDSEANLKAKLYAADFNIRHLAKIVWGNKWKEVE